MSYCRGRSHSTRNSLRSLATDASVLTGAVEGAVDEVILRRLVREAGRNVGTVYVTRGITNLFRRLPGFNAAAEHAPWVVLIDLDAAECAPALIQRHVPRPSSGMLIRVAVRAVESWLLADRECLAEFLSVSPSRIPQDPDGEQSPKDALVEIARHSRRRSIREDMVPRAGSGRRVGPAYEARLIEFIAGRSESPTWQPRRAAESSSSLRRCLTALDEAAYI